MQLLSDDANLKLGQFVSSASESQWVKQIGDTYGDLKEKTLSSSYYNQTFDYSLKTKDYVNELINNSTTINKASEMKDQLFS